MTAPDISPCTLFNIKTNNKNKTNKQRKNCNNFAYRVCSAFLTKTFLARKLFYAHNVYLFTRNSIFNTKTLRFLQKEETYRASLYGKVLPIDRKLSSFKKRAPGSPFLQPYFLIQPNDTLLANVNEGKCKRKKGLLHDACINNLNGGGGGDSTNSVIVT